VAAFNKFHIRRKLYIAQRTKVQAEAKVKKD